MLKFPMPHRLEAAIAELLEIALQERPLGANPDGAVRVTVSWEDSDAPAPIHGLRNWIQHVTEGE